MVLQGRVRLWEGALGRRQRGRAGQRCDRRVGLRTTVLAFLFTEESLEDRALLPGLDEELLLLGVLDGLAESPALVGLLQVPSMTGPRLGIMFKAAPHAAALFRMV